MNDSDLFTNILDLLVGLQTDERDTIELGPDDYTVKDSLPRELPADDPDR